METPFSCVNLRDELLAIAGGAAAPSLVALAASHAAVCAPCARLLERERRLVAMLRALPAAPELPVARPELPAHAGSGRLLRWPGIAAACAAAGLVAAAWVSWQTQDRVLFPADLRFVDVAGAGAGPDDRILLLTAGPEAVAARRPASGR